VAGGNRTIWPTLKPRGGEQAANVARNAEELSRRHFLLHDGRPAHVAAINPAEMDPFLRGLLFTDGTVTRTLEVKMLSPVSVTVVSQADSTANNDVANHLEVPDGTETVRRRVMIGRAGNASPAIWAESHILPSRLPAGFLGILGNAPDGIGESLQRVALESWRDMLWFGLGPRPGWSFAGSQAPAPVITRLYRVITDGQPALLISESFAIEERAGTYCLKWPA
jgi:chorismate-pyruvate lyase